MYFIDNIWYICVSWTRVSVSSIEYILVARRLASYSTTFLFEYNSIIFVIRIELNWIPFCYKGNQIEFK